MSLLVTIGAIATGPPAEAAGLEPVVVLTPEAPPDGSRLVVPDGESVTFDASGTHSPSGSPLHMWWWVDTEGPYAVGQSTFEAFLAPGNHVVTVTALDLATQQRRSAKRIVQVGDNPRPRAVVTPGGTQRIPVGSSVTFSGSDSQRLGEGATCQWFVDGVEVPNGGAPGRDGQPGGCNFWADNPEDLRLPRLTYTPTVAGWHTIKLKVRDMIGATHAKVIWVKAIGAAAPVASIAPAGDRAVNVGTTLTFNGSGSYDPDNSKLRYRWYSTGKAGTVSKTSSYTRSFDKVGRFRVRLVVLDTDNNRAVQTVTITVRGLQPPVAALTPGSAQTVKTGTRVTFDGSGSHDPDGGQVRYRWYSTGVSGVASAKPQFARTFDKAGTYRVRVVVLDVDNNWTAKTVEITATT